MVTSGLCDIMQVTSTLQASYHSSIKWRAGLVILSALCSKKFDYKQPSYLIGDNCIIIFSAKDIMTYF